MRLGNVNDKQFTPEQAVIVEIECRKADAWHEEQILITKQEEKKMKKKYVTVSRWGCDYYMLDKNLNIVDACYIDNGEDVTGILKNRAAILGYEIKEAYKK